MAKICYVPKKFDKTWLIVIRQANKILEDYGKQGLILTIRQLYYQFVARDIFPDDRKWKQVGNKWVRHKNGTKNATPNYKWLSSVIGDARLAGWIDWELIEAELKTLVEPKQWKKDLAEKAKVKKELIGIATEWSSIPKQKEKIISLEERLAQAEEKVVNLQRMVVAGKKPAKRSYSQRLKKVVKKKSLKKPL